MRALHAPGAVADFRARLDRLEAGAVARWGTLDAARMLAHVAAALENALGRRPAPTVGGAAGWAARNLFRRLAFNGMPFPKNAPTSPVLRASPTADFAAEKARVDALLRTVEKDGARVWSAEPHPLFGSLSPEERGRNQSKHLHHHLIQFGV